MLSTRPGCADCSVQVYSVQWCPGQASLLTASMDKTMIVWQQMEDTQVSYDWSAAGHNTRL